MKYTGKNRRRGVSERRSSRGKCCTCLASAATTLAVFLFLILASIT